MTAYIADSHVVAVDGYIRVGPRVTAPGQLIQEAANSNVCRHAEAALLTRWMPTTTPGLEAGHHGI